MIPGSRCSVRVCFEPVAYQIPVSEVGLLGWGPKSHPGLELLAAQWVNIVAFECHQHTKQDSHQMCTSVFLF